MYRCMEWKVEKCRKQKRRRHEGRSRQGEWEGLCVLKRKMMDREGERETGRERERERRRHSGWWVIYSTERLAG